MPDLIWLLVFGLILGPVLNLVDRSIFIEISPVISVATIILITFEAGTDIDYETLKSVLPTTIVLSVFTFTLITVGTGLVTPRLFPGLGFTESLMLGTFLGGISTVAVMSAMDKLSIVFEDVTESRLILYLESTIVDPIRVMTAIALIRIMLRSEVLPREVFKEIFFVFLAGAVVGLLSGVLWMMVLHRLRNLPNNYMVNVPVKLYTMIRDHSPGFSYVRKEDACPIEYRRVCKYDGEVVPWHQIAKGMEVKEGEYIVFDKEELEALRPESNKKIDLDKFFPLDQVDKVFFEKSYMLLPDEDPESYGLLLKALQAKKMAGVGKFTLRTKEYPVVIYPYRGALVLSRLRYADEVVDPKAMEGLEEVEEPSHEELELALKIIDNLEGDFDITEYKDTYRKRVAELVEKKLKGETIKVKEPGTEEVKELMEALQETLQNLNSSSAS